MAVAALAEKRQATITRDAKRASMAAAARRSVRAPRAWSRRRARARARRRVRLALSSDASFQASQHRSRRPEREERRERREGRDGERRERSGGGKRVSKQKAGRDAWVVWPSDAGAGKEPIVTRCFPFPRCIQQPEAMAYIYTPSLLFLLLLTSIVVHQGQSPLGPLLPGTLPGIEGRSQRAVGPEGHHPAQADLFLATALQERLPRGPGAWHAREGMGNGWGRGQSGSLLVTKEGGPEEFLHPPSPYRLDHPHPSHPLLSSPCLRSCPAFTIAPLTFPTTITLLPQTQPPLSLLQPSLILLYSPLTQPPPLLSPLYSSTSTHPRAVCSACA